MDKENIFVWEALSNMLIKIVLTIVSIIAYFIILYYIINSKSLEERLTFGALDSMLTFTYYKIVNHYFPAIKAVAKKK